MKIGIKGERGGRGGEETKIYNILQISYTFLNCATYFKLCNCKNYEIKLRASLRTASTKFGGQRKNTVGLHMQNVPLRLLKKKKKEKTCIATTNAFN